MDESEARDRVRRELARFAEARVRTFVALLVERAVAEDLARARADRRSATG